MTEEKSNLPAIVQPTREIARTDTDSWTNVFSDVLELARGIAGTEFVPRSLRDSIPATTAAILYGREVGLPPMTALNSTHVIEGRPSLEAQAMRAMIIAAGHEIEVLESTGAVCQMRARRNGSERWTPVVVWSIDMARAADLLGKKNWKNYPRRMLQARCTSELAELYFPDVIMGFRSIEEMQDVAEGEGDEPKQTTAVQRAPRKRAAAKKATTAQAPTAPREPVAGPPLPGEPGYDDPAETSAGGEAQGEGSEPPVDTDDSGAVNGETAETAEGQPTTADHLAAEVVPAAPESSPDEDDIHDAELVSDDGAIIDPDDPGDVPAEEIERRRQAEEQAAQAGPRLANRAQVRALNTILERTFDVTGTERHRVVSALVGREITTLNAVTADEVSPLLDALKMLDGREALDALVLASEQRRAAQEGEQS